MFYCYAHNWTHYQLQCPLCQTTKATTNAGTENFFEPTALFTHDQCQIKYESLLAQAEKLEEALFAIKKHTLHPDNKPSVWNDYLQDLADEALAEFKKWKDGR